MALNTNPSGYCGSPNFTLQRKTASCNKWCISASPLNPPWSEGTLLWSCSSADSTSTSTVTEDYNQQQIPLFCAFLTQLSCSGWCPEVLGWVKSPSWRINDIILNINRSEYPLLTSSTCYTNTGTKHRKSRNKASIPYLSGRIGSSSRFKVPWIPWHKSAGISVPWGTQTPAGGKLPIIQSDRTLQKSTLHKIRPRLRWKVGNINTTFPQRLKKRTCASRRYLRGLCTVQLLDEVVERVSLPQKNEVAAEAVSFLWGDEREKEEILRKLERWFS